MAYNDVFKEQLVARKQNSTDTLKKVGIVVGAVIIFLIATMVPVLAQFIAFILVGLGWGVFILIRRFNVEYEYVFTNGELDIDKIYNRSKRKSAYSVDVRRFVVMVQVNNPSLQSELGRIDQVLDFSIGVPSETTYAAVVESEGKRIKILIDPNEIMFNAIKMYIPRKIKK